MWYGMELAGAGLRCTQHGKSARKGRDPNRHGAGVLCLRFSPEPIARTSASMRTRRGRSATGLLRALSVRSPRHQMVTCGWAQSSASFASMVSARSRGNRLPVSVFPLNGLYRC